MCFSIFTSRFHKRLLPSIGWLFLPVLLLGQQKRDIDSTNWHAIKEITITEKIKPSERHSSSPLQVLTTQKIEKLNVLQVSDAVKFFSGVMVKDYGGIGGLKTISARSLGANHTAVSYDGITVTDCQTGQIDIGRFSLDNIEMLSLNSGQSDNIFQPARLFASASVLNIQTIKPKFEMCKNINGKVAMKIGSFGMINPTIGLALKINSKLSASFSGEWLSADGKYPYTLKYGSATKDSTSTETRQNTDVKNIRLEGAVFSNFSENERAYIKTYFYQSERGLPGATILYNAENSSKERIWDNTFFTQAHYEKEFSRLFSFQTNAKYNQSYLKYFDPTYLDSKGSLENIFVQKEYYASASVHYRAFDFLSFSASSDGALNTLNADFFVPNRITWLSSVATKYVSSNILATASLLATVVNEKTNNKHLSPYLSFSAKPFDNQDFRIRLFYKNIFRLPSFNDLYYSQVGNRDLKPENANQYNFGITYATSNEKWLHQLLLTIDGYHNDVTDKIVAYPTKNIYVWAMKNLGKVAIDGIDISAETTISPWDKIGFNFGTTYTYQRALNVTDATDRSTYKHQLPYTPRISGSGKIGIETPWINLNYTVLWSGHRYALFQNYAENRLPAYNDQSISANRSFQTKHHLLTATIEILNLFNQNYAVVKWFPMPGRSIRATVSVKF